MGSTTKANHVQVPVRQGKENSFLERKRSSEGCSKQSVVFHLLSPCQERSGVFLLPMGLCYQRGAWEYLLLVPQFYLISFSLLIFFTTLLKICKIHKLNHKCLNKRYRSPLWTIKDLFEAITLLIMKLKIIFFGRNKANPGGGGREITLK